MRLRGRQPPEIHQSDEQKKRLVAEWAKDVHRFGWVRVMRNAEGVNIDLNGLGASEHVAPDMLRDLYGSAKEAAGEAAKRAGGVMPVVSVALFRNPELKIRQRARGGAWGRAGGDHRRVRQQGVCT